MQQPGSRFFSLAAASAKTWSHCWHEGEVGVQPAGVQASPANRALLNSIPAVPRTMDAPAPMTSANRICRFVRISRTPCLSRASVSTKRRSPCRIAVESEPPARAELSSYAVKHDYAAHADPVRPVPVSAFRPLGVFRMIGLLVTVGTRITGSCIHAGQQPKSTHSPLASHTPHSTSQASRIKCRIHLHRDNLEILVQNLVGCKEWPQHRHVYATSPHHPLATRQANSCGSLKKYLHFSVLRGSARKGDRSPSVACIW